MPAPTLAPPAAPRLTWEAYLREPQVEGSYDIIDGVRVTAMAGPSGEHQEVVGRVYELLREYQRATRGGRTYQAPLDVLITRAPLRTRQPDVLFVGRDALETVGGPFFAAPLPVAPLLVVEVRSENETDRRLADKLRDYCRAGVPEAWVVDPATRTVEVLRLAGTGPARLAMLRAGDTLSSEALPGFAAPVESLFDLGD